MSGYSRHRRARRQRHRWCHNRNRFAIFAGAPATIAAHVAFDAPSRQAVDAFHAAALANGGRERGAPGVWAQYSERYYAAFVWDPDGNNVEAVFHSPEPLAGLAPIRHPEDAR